jgi:diguanylate cyclase (GGDEF)-like protein/PAS domain S-box-containing protein
MTRDTPGAPSSRSESEVFKAIFDHSPTAQAVIKPGPNRTAFANPALVSLFAIAGLEDVVPMSLVHPEDQDQVAAELLRLATGDAARVVLHARLLRGDGSMFHGQLAATALPDEAGSASALLVTVEDITTQVEGAAALARSEARARALIENSPDIIAILYPDGEWEASDQGTRLMGYPKGADVGLMDLIHPDDLEKASAALGEVIAGTRSPFEPLELRLRDAWGAYREFECVGRNLEEDADIQGVVVTARDVTARKRTEAQLRAAEQRFQVAFEHAPIAITIVDLDGRIVDTNPAACAMRGRTAEELRGSLAADYIHPADRDRARREVLVQITGSASPVEFRIVNADGTAMPVLSHSALVRDANDEPLHVITSQADITDRKKLEAELERRALHDDLTDLPNRAALWQHLHFALASRPFRLCAAFFIDLDNFKAVNDGFGHAAGDEVLIRVARQLRDVVRRGDIAARVGGDEFVVVAEIRDAEQAKAIADRIQEALQQRLDESLPAIAVSASVGVAVAHVDDDPESLLRRADTAAYIAKRAGRSRSEIIGVDADPAPAG